MSSTLLLPPRAQLCNRSCSNKTHTLGVPTPALAPATVTTSKRPVITDAPAAATTVAEHRSLHALRATLAATLVALPTLIATTLSRISLNSSSSCESRVSTRRPVSSPLFSTTTMWHPTKFSSTRAARASRTTVPPALLLTLLPDSWTTAAMPATLTTDFSPFLSLPPFLCPVCWEHTPTSSLEHQEKTAVFSISMGIKTEVPKNRVSKHTKNFLFDTFASYLILLFPI